MKYLKQATKVAIKGRNKKQYHLGCVVQRRDKSIVTAFNSRTREKAPSIHAEAKALRKAGMGGIMFVSRVMADGSVGLSKPCKDCQKLIRQHKVKKVYYTIDDNNIGIFIP